MHKLQFFEKLFILLIAVIVLFSTGSAVALEKSRQGEKRLLDTYRKNIARLEKNSFGLPLFLESSERNNVVNVDVYGIFDYPYNSVVNVLKVPKNWCDIVSLHQNVKACTYNKQPETEPLTFYIGRKEYQLPEDTRPVIYNYRIVEQQPRYLDIILTADAGPFGTTNHKMRFEALRLKGGRTFVHVSYAYSDSAALRLATKAYFATLARSKVGFTVTGTDKKGNPIYIGGSRGSIERNAVRYYYAIEAFMNSMAYPENERFSRRINEWYDLTNRHKKQLFELSKEDYVTFKTKEHKNQVTLQRQVGTTP